MNDLAVIERENKQWVNARDLHERMEVGRHFAGWITERIEECGFEEGRDYLILPESGKNQEGLTPDLAKTSPNENGFYPDSGKTSPLGGRPEINYLLTITAALILSAMENSPHRQEILKLLSKTAEAWNTPEMVATRAEQMGVGISTAKFDQLSAQLNHIWEMACQQLTENGKQMIKNTQLLEQVKKRLEDPDEEANLELEKYVRKSLGGGSKYRYIEDVHEIYHDFEFRNPNVRIHFYVQTCADAPGIRPYL